MARALSGRERRCVTESFTDYQMGSAGETGEDPPARRQLCHHLPMTTRLVYSSDRGRLCPTCGWPVDDCRCSQNLNAPIPTRVTAKLRLESKGRGGKSVTVVDGLPDNTPFLEDLAKALKKACATGGTVRPGAVELAGDVRDRVRTLLRDRGFVVKG